MDNEDEIIQWMKQDLYSRSKESWDEIDWDTYYYLQSLGVLS